VPAPREKHLICDPKATCACLHLVITHLGISPPMSSNYISHLNPGSLFPQNASRQPSEYPLLAVITKIDPSAANFKFFVPLSFIWFTHLLIVPVSDACDGPLAEPWIAEFDILYSPSPTTTTPKHEQGRCKKGLSSYTRIDNGCRELGSLSIAGSFANSGFISSSASVHPIPSTSLS